MGHLLIGLVGTCEGLCKVYWGLQHEAMNIIQMNENKAKKVQSSRHLLWSSTLKDPEMVSDSVDFRCNVGKFLISARKPEAHT